MKAHERREAGLTGKPGFKIAAWDARSFTFREVKGTHDTEADARRSAKKPGKYRVSRVVDGSWADATTFEV
jgi:hypothetical protein